MGFGAPVTFLLNYFSTKIIKSHNVVHKDANKYDFIYQDI